VDKALKFDNEKVPLHLIDPLFNTATAHVLDFGQKKYAPWNWAKGTFNWSQLYRAAKGHIEAWWSGEEFDVETGLPHLWHANCCLMFLTRYTYDGLGRDDRPTFPHSAIPNDTKPCRPNPEHVARLQAASLHAWEGVKRQLNEDREIEQRKQEAKRAGQRDAGLPTPEQVRGILKSDPMPKDRVAEQQRPVVPTRA
jgi:hypothetical protein